MKKSTFLFTKTFNIIIELIILVTYLDTLSIKATNWMANRAMAAKETKKSNRQLIKCELMANWQKPHKINILNNLSYKYWGSITMAMTPDTMHPNPRPK